jgi:hypothetical protein
VPLRTQYAAYLEWIRVLAKSVKMRILRKLSTKSQVLRLEDEIRSSSIEQSGRITTATRDRKREWVVNNLVSKLRQYRDISFCARAREN